MSYTDGIYLLLGSNLGDKLTNLQKAIQLINTNAINVKRVSSVYESEPWGISNQPVFYNAVVEITTKLTEKELLDYCLLTENELGRKRIIKWGERIIDIDILYYHTSVINSQALSIPHPGIPERRFTLVPLCELAPELIHPQLGISNQELLDKCEDSLGCMKIEKALIL